VCNLKKKKEEEKKEKEKKGYQINTNVGYLNKRHIKSTTMWVI